MPTFQHRTEINADVTALEQWHLQPGALRRLTPPWERLRIIEEPPAIVDGARAELEMRVGPFRTRWVAEHQDCRPGESFSDLQVRGPFAHWSHLHRFSRVNDGTSTLSDEIDYRLPLGFVGNLLGGGMVRKKLARTFHYRHAVTKMDLERLRFEPPGDGRPMEVLVTGATGLVGRSLEAFLQMRGHRMRRVTRRPSRPGDVRWNPEAGVLDLPDEDPIDAVVHLAGENVAGGRWTGERKRRILESRRKGTRLLCETLARRKRPPTVLVSASGANYYATGTEHPQDESAPRGSGFLSDVCEAWEAETAVAEQAGIRVAKLRLGVILTPAGGALAKMLPAFKLGLAGRLGSGTQRMPWIVLDDVIDVIHRAIRDDRYTGAINCVGPEVVDSAGFTRALSTVLHRPAIIPVPAAALRLALGKQMAEETLLVDLHIEPARLSELGYPFRFPRIEGALAYLLGASPPPGPNSDES